MSLLLDALKKAAEKKARSDAEKTEIEPTEVHAEEPTQVDSTVSVTETLLDPTRRDATEFTATEIEDTRIDTTSVTQTHVVEADVEETEIQQTELDETAFERSQEEETQLDDETIRSSSADATETVISADADSDDIGEETVVLTPDDVTEFLGDGLPDRTEQPSVDRSPASPPSHVTYETSDDTTITNSEQLDLTQFENEESLRIQPEDDTDYPTATDTASIPDYAQPPQSQADDSDEDHGGEGDEETTVVGGEATSSTVDIERLTNDETVTVKDSTSTRTFAPDNYDRTLLKISDGDVSKIFPGMKSESDTVMTPEYAKKVFQSKSHGVKSHYYKVYLVVGVLMLAGVLLWGMFSVSDEIEVIDNSLVRLKRDPMPGLLKSNAAETDADLFAQPKSEPVDERVREVVATADGTGEGSLAASESERATSSETSEPATTESGVATSAEAASATTRSMTEDSPATGTSESSTSTFSTQARVVSGSGAVDRPVATRSEPATASPALKISTVSRVSQKDQLLTQAYNAYESGDIDEARSKYDRVLEIESENRDALLGRAAIYVLDNDFSQAVAFYQRLLVANPKDDLALTSLISVASVDPRAGETEVKRLLNERPDSPYLHFALGNMYGNQQRWPEAQNSYFNALKYRPDDPNYAYNLAVSLEHLQKQQSAITYYQLALQNRQNALATFSRELVTQRLEVLTR